MKLFALLKFPIHCYTNNIQTSKFKNNEIQLTNEQIQIFQNKNN